MDCAPAIAELDVLRDDPPAPSALRGAEEFFAAGFYELPDASPSRRWSRALRRYFECRRMLPYAGTALYPWGACSAWSGWPEDTLLRPCHSYTWSYRPDRLDSVLGRCRDAAARGAVQRLDRHFAAIAKVPRWMPPPHDVAGNGWTHSVPDYCRVSREGLDGVEARVRRCMSAAAEGCDAAREDFHRGLLDLLAGVRAWHGRIIEHLRAWATGDGGAAARRDRLVAALGRVPFRPARTFYEALLAHTFVFYLDLCDNPGRIDLELAPFYEADLAAGRITRGEALELLREFSQIISDTGTWSASIGGTDPRGRAAYSQVTELCLEALIGHHRPNTQLRVRRDMPARIWTRAMDAIAAATGQPALYNEELYLAGLRQAVPQLTDDDLAWWNGAGCTETLIQGRTNCGSVDMGFNLPLILTDTLRRELAAAGSFAQVLAAYEHDLRATIADQIARFNGVVRNRMAMQPQPIRSLLTDDCIERGVDFNAGGARYNWSLLSMAGLANVADSLSAVREAVFERRFCTGGQLLAAMDANFAGAESLRARLQRCARYGNDDAAVDGLAARVFAAGADEMARHRLLRGGGPFLPCCILFSAAPAAGRRVAATPDGRLAGEPIADSIGPHQGRDRNGPTAAIRSVTRVALRRAVGTPVFNLRLHKQLFQTAEGRRRIEDLVRTFFDLGGMQMQITVADAATLREAIAHPDRHRDLAVRVGGFSARFTELSRDLQEMVLRRTEHGF